MMWKVAIKKFPKSWAIGERAEHHMSRIGGASWYASESKEPWHAKSLGGKTKDIKRWLREERAEHWHEFK